MEQYDSAIAFDLHRVYMMLMNAEKSPATSFKSQTNSLNVKMSIMYRPDEYFACALNAR